MPRGADHEPSDEQELPAFNLVLGVSADDAFVILEGLASPQT